MKRSHGFTLTELAVAMTLGGLVLAQLGMLMRVRASTESTQQRTISVDDQARRVLDQIAWSVIGAGAESLKPSQEAPLDSPELNYTVCLGVEDGVIVWGDPQWIGLAGGDRQVMRKERPEQIDERRVVFSNAVRPLLEGELMNGKDDNGNGLIDEKGLSFTVQGETVTIRLTLERAGENGKPVSRTIESVVTCRN